MSRWIDAANKNPFEEVWVQLLSAVDDITVDESTEIETVQELSRLKKILTLIDQILMNSDAELIPVSVYGQWHQFALPCWQHVQQYQVNKSRVHLVTANKNADSIFSSVRPYMLIYQQGLSEYGEALKSHTDKVASYILSFEQSAKKSQSALSIANGEAIAQKKRIDDFEVKFKNFYDYLFEASDEEESAENSVKEMLEKIAIDQKAISDLHDKLFVGPESTSQLIGGYQRDIDQMRQRMNELANSSQKEHEELKKFYHRIFGELIDGDSKSEKGGLRHEIEERLKQLGVFEEDHQIRHAAMFKKVESLLPGATSAGLATAYKSLKDSFDQRIKDYTTAFYCALVVLLISGILMIFDFTSSPFKIELVKPHDWHEMLKTLLVRAPIVIPVVWFAVFSATRRSQYERLQQEYAHKEALASSYEGYKKQLQDLKGDAEDLQKELIAKSINAIAYNASTTLDGKHTEKPPVFQMLEKLNADELKKLLELVRGK